MFRQGKDDLIDSDYTVVTYLNSFVNVCSRL